MYLLEALDYYRKNKDAKSEYSEFEILCRNHLTGVLDLGCAYLQFWEMPRNFEQAVVRAHYLKIIALPGDLSLQTPRGQEYYIPGGIQNEIVILMTLFSRSHFVLSRMLKLGNILLMNKYADEEDVAKGDMDGKVLALGDFKPYFDMLEGLRKTEEDKSLRRLEPFMLAARFYHLGFSLIGKDETLAYISFVSAVESLLHDYNINSITLEDWNEQAARLIKESTPDDKYQEIQKVILANLPRIKQRFIACIKEHLTERFWSDPTRPKGNSNRFNDVSEIEKYLGRIYDARSGTLHAGKPFPPSVENLNIERPMGTGIIIGNKVWEEKELIPPVRAFERIVHHVLLEYLKRESSKAQ